MINTVCNSTLEDMRIGPTSEVEIVGPLTFHGLALVISGGASFIAIVVSLFLILMHATHYTRPREQKVIMRILLMVPVYAAASFLGLKFYWHNVYYQVISNCYEAFAISSFFSLTCHYVAPNLHEQKQYFRELRPLRPWLFPLSWFKKCCGGDRGMWRTPQSGLTFFNILWIGIYQYCFIRVTMTIIAVVTQYFNRYCESSWTPVFSYFWCEVFVTIGVSVAMYCLFQLYFQMKDILKENKIFLKVVAIKLVIFLSFWQDLVISAATSSYIGLLHPNSTLAYPDIKVGIPNLILCVEMAFFAVLHIWAFPYSPYRNDAKPIYYPLPDPNMNLPQRENERFSESHGGFLGWRAFLDVINIWDVIKAFGRGMRWLFVGVKHRHADVSYQTTRKNSVNGDMGVGGFAGPKPPTFDEQDTAYPMRPYGADSSATSTAQLPVIDEFGRSKFDAMDRPGPSGQSPYNLNDDVQQAEENARLIAHAQPNPSSIRRDETSPYRDQAYPQRSYPLSPQPRPQDPFQDQQVYNDPSSQDPFRGRGRTYQQPQTADFDDEIVSSPTAIEQAGYRRDNRSSTQMRVGEALWGPQGQQPGPGRF